MNKLSVALATFNEAENIERCLLAVKDIAHEMIVVDGDSSDKTREIAKKCGARVIKTTNKPMFHTNKQMALDAAKGDWILQLDADEVVSKPLAKEIQRTINLSEEQIRHRRFSPKQAKLFSRHQQLIERRDGRSHRDDQETCGYFLPRRNFFINRFLHHGGVYPDGVIRLVKRGKAYFPQQSVHEQIVVDGRVAWLENDLLHYDSPTFAKYLHRANRYTSLTATKLSQQKLSINPITFIEYIIIKPIYTFTNMYIRHKGFLDGFPGFIFALFSGLHFSIAYMKYFTVQKKP